MCNLTIATKITILYNMLHRILIISPSGMILYSKEFTIDIMNKTNKSTQLAGIITAMHSFSYQRTGYNISYIQCDNISVSLYRHNDTQLTCALFHDTSDSEIVGQLLCKTYITTFISYYNNQLNTFNYGVTTDKFIEFNNRIYNITRNSVKPILDELESTRGIICVLLINSTGDTLTTGNSMLINNNINLFNNNDTIGKMNLSLMTFQQLQQITSNGNNSYYHNNNNLHNNNMINNNNAIKHSDIDKLSVLANHQALISTANDIMNSQYDTLHTITLRSRRSTLVLHRLYKCSLIVLMKNSVDQNTCNVAIDKAANILRKIIQIAMNLKT